MSKTYQTINPATEESLQTFELHSEEQACEIVAATHNAFIEWRKTDFKTRGQILLSMAELLRERQDYFISLITREMGKPIAQGRDEIELCATICEYTAHNGADFLAEEERSLEDGRALVTYQPIGVILGIQPWNFPFYQVVRYSAANIMAGNAVLLKHAPNVWGCALEIEKLFREAGLPEHVFSVLLIDDEQADDLIEHGHVRGVTFTGSPETGSIVAAKAGQCRKKSMLELGSNDAYLVLADADVDKAVATCVQGRIINNGQTCTSAKRFIVVDSLYDQFRDAFIEQMRQVSYGDPMDPDIQLGPIAREDLRDKLHDLVQRSIDQGAACALGGKIPEGPGFFYPPTVLENLEPGMPAYGEELFGPAASLIRVKDEEEAIRVANDSRYGLGGGVFSKDEEHAIDIARNRLDTGMVNINGYRVAQPNLPFGGVKDSGYGREHGGFGIREFVNIKSLMIGQD